jgi:hypothetical protein
VWLVFDYRENDIYLCVAYIGRVTEHSYMIYGPLRQRRDHLDDSICVCLSSAGRGHASRLLITAPQSQ